MDCLLISILYRIDNRQNQAGTRPKSIQRGNRFVLSGYDMNGSTHCMTSQAYISSTPRYERLNNPIKREYKSSPWDHSPLSRFLVISLGFVSVFHLWGIFVLLFFLFVFLEYPIIRGGGGLSNTTGCFGGLESYCKYKLLYPRN